MPAPLPVLFVHYGEEWLRGSEQVLLDLLRHLDRDRIAPVLWCNGAALAEAGREAGIPTQRSPFAFYFDYPGSSPPFAPRQYAAQLREAVGLIRRHDIGVLHANSAAPTQWLAPAAAWTRRPLLTHLHIGYRRRSRYALLLHEADLVVGVAGPVTAPLLADGMPPARLRTIPNGIDPARLEPAGPSLRERLGIGPEALVIGAVGSLIRRKGHDVLLRAVARLAPELPTAQVLIAGSGEEEPALRGLAAELGLAGRVHFLGNLDRPGAVYAASDLCALATRAESFGLVFVEAGWFGRPSVATRVGGVPEVIADGETGLLTPPEDVPAFAEALRRLCTDAALRGRLGAAARARVEQRFLAPAMAAAFMDAYEALAGSGRGASLGLSRLRCYGRLVRGDAGRP